MIDTKALREKILDLAIRGKLVPQDPNDEPASVLLERIREQKQQMVKEGMLKAKDIKNDTIIFRGEDNLHYEKYADGSVKCIEDEIPFDVPEGWAWTRLGVICPYGDTIKIDANDIRENEWILDLEDVEKDTGRIISFVLKSERNSVSQKHKFERGQLLYSKLRPYLNKVLIAPEDGYCTSEILPLTLYGGILPEFIKSYMMSNTFLAYVDLISYGVKMPRLGTDDGKRALIAVPPIHEQCCIIGKIQELTPIIQSLAEQSNELTTIIGTIKSHILNLAIRGKLVPQDPSDEPASVLLERIRAEKEELIKQGKIKRYKKESVIFKGEDNSYYEKVGNEVIDISDEVPYEIPDNWTFVRLEDVLIYEQPTPYIVDLTDYNDSYPTPVLTAGKSFIIGYSNETTGIKTDLPVIIFDDFTTDSKYVDFPFKVKSSAMKILTAEVNIIDIKYAYYAMQTVECDNYNHKRYWISEFSQKLIPLPPYSEQNRIVEAIETMNKMLDTTFN